MINYSSLSNIGIPQIPKNCVLGPLSQGLYFDVPESFGTI